MYAFNQVHLISIVVYYALCEGFSHLFFWTKIPHFYLVNLWFHCCLNFNIFDVVHFSRCWDIFKKLSNKLKFIEELCIETDWYILVYAVVWNKYVSKLCTYKFSINWKIFHAKEKSAFQTFGKLGNWKMKIDYTYGKIEKLKTCEYNK